MNVLITGGAGYIGSHVAKKLLKEGFFVTIVDNLSTGFIEPINILNQTFENLEFIKGDLSDDNLLEKIFNGKKIETVMHLAAKIDTAESLAKPDLYHQENYLNGINLIKAMTAYGVKKIVFSSTAAVYGKPRYTPIDENHSTLPITPYGQTKLDFEKYLGKIENLKFVILRYFNVGGADSEGKLGKSHLGGNDLIENCLKCALGQIGPLPIYGNDYPTPDGTAIRDFLDVEDIADAHLAAMIKIDDISGEVFNLGSEKGFSVAETIEIARRVTGKEIKTVYEKRREGDIPISVASSEKAKLVLDWNPLRSNLETIISSDWDWRKNNIHGYQSKGAV